jgi:Transglycosylase SLT domain/HWE histidine kinase
MSPSTRGSMHGEIGQTQFLPKNILAYGTGNLDVAANALNSTANFLKARGWSAGAGYQPGEANFADHIQFLMHEISHRSKNLLSVIQSIARRTARTARTMEEFEGRFEGVFRALLRRTTCSSARIGRARHSRSSCANNSVPLSRYKVHALSL